MEIIFTVNHNNLIAFADLNSGQIFKMVNTDDVRTFGEDCLCMKTDTGDFVILASTKYHCGKSSQCSNRTDLEIEGAKAPLFFVHFDEFSTLKH